MRKICYTDKLSHEGIDYVLDRRSGQFSLYGGPILMRKFRSFLLVKNEQIECAVPFAHPGVMRAKFFRWSRGEFKHFTWRTLRPREDRDRSNLMAYASMSLDDVLNVLNGAVRLCDVTNKTNQPG
jgi:hypothetical protein